ncbi:MAG: response regulator, partial [Candidatus Omnitrophota bacterium]
KIICNELLREIKSVENIEKTPIVIFTSSKQDKDIVKSYRNGANSYIIKPVDSEKFEDIISEVCHYWVEINEPAR